MKYIFRIRVTSDVCVAADTEDEALEKAAGTFWKPDAAGCEVISQDLIETKGKET